MYRDYEHLQFDEPEPGILRVIFSNPGKRNALTVGAHEELARLWGDVDRDSAIRVVIVTGEGDSFSAGGDLSESDAPLADFDARTEGMRQARDLVYGIINCSKPVVSAITGPAVGAGLAVGLLADVAIVTPSAKLIDGHLRIGVAAGDHAVMIWPLLCGLAKARYYLLTCRPISGEEAERLGLVALCVPEEELQDRALEIARGLAQGPQTAIRWTKLALNGWLRDAGSHFDTSNAYQLAGFFGPDAEEGTSAVRERRAPSFGPGAKHA